MKNIALVVICLFLFACGTVDDGRSGSKILITKIADSSNTNTVITSDVLTGGNVTDDTAVIGVEVLPYDIKTTTTNLMDVVIDQIDVEYSRSDGKNIPGKDIPFAYSLPVSQLIPVGSSDTLSGVVLVRHIAKVEPPLVELVGMGAENILYLNCKVTVNGKDATGRRVTPAVGYIQIQCGDFAD